MVPSTFSRLNAARALPVVLAALLFAGCGTQRHPGARSKRRVRHPGARSKRSLYAGFSAS
ncbi:hypothetical protein LTSERUB_5188 [Salmonella enterica subsp. enterica serovar Rubislaw str. A4-653]|uniref:Uncharacterized protein n=1 Tax=Salmonella enterica subsp. enterica serovar Rubislaw str. A4-653 TaxID=913081 RepID=G5QQ53_SALRU|nr:hypothetical protein LTSERUB_5188 [Salmonella enterica subsp. enterica serovar Rubislaw str. A4-653]